jgi:hypothetical protein
MLISFLQIPVYGQQVSDLLNLYFSEVRNCKYPAIPKPVSIGENADETLASIKSYLTDTLTTVRAKAYAIAHLAGTNSRVPSVRLVYVNHLVNACKDEDSGNVGLSLSYLSQFLKKDFTPSALDSIRNLVRRKTPHFEDLLKLAGFLELKDLQSIIQPYTQAGNSRQVRWAAIIALARMGDAEALTNMMARVKRLPVNDDVVYEVFPDLVYTRQREALDYLITTMQSDAKNCMSADAERETAIICGYRIMEQLSPAIEGYPLKLDESGDIETKDYVSALSTVRDWFSKHKDYKIDRERF